MRHGKKTKSLGRKSSHRKAMLSNMACSLIEHKRIQTTVAKAKVLRVYLEPLLTKAKTDSTHSRRVVFGYLQSKEAINELYREVAPKIADRPGGYLRIIRLGNRLGDNAEMCMIELVDFNELMTKESTTKKTTRRSRRGSGASSKPAKEATAKVEESAKSDEATAETEVATPEVESKEETPKKEEPKNEPKEQTKKESKEEPKGASEDTTKDKDKE